MSATDTRGLGIGHTDLLRPWSQMIRQIQRFIEALACTFRQIGLREIAYQLDCFAKRINHHSAVLAVFQMLLNLQTQLLRRFTVKICG
jgi:hypothetical protein